MNAPSIIPSNHAGPVDQASLTRLLASASVSALPAAIETARKALRPATPDRIAQRAARLLSHYWQPDEPVGDTEMRLADWAEVLCVFPDWAIKAAMLEFQRSGTKARPTPAGIANLCDKQVRPVREELSKARAVLDRRSDAPPPKRTPEERARVAAMVAGVTKGMPK